MGLCIQPLSRELHRGPPKRDPILSFLHAFSPKSAHVGRRRSKRDRRPPKGNPGSAPELHNIQASFITIELLKNLIIFVN